MRIDFIELANFRKLKGVRIDFAEKTTLFVGANNSGKTSAMVALGHFLAGGNRFATADFTLSNWASINKIGADWESEAAAGKFQSPAIAPWEALLPSLDVWLSVNAGELHYVRDLIPTLGWKSGRLGVRLRFEPKDVGELKKDYLTAIRAATKTKQSGVGAAAKSLLWPEDLRTFLDRKLTNYFAVRAHLLDPTKCVDPTEGTASPQQLPAGTIPLEGNLLASLIRIDEIAAQRGLADSVERGAGSDGAGNLANRTKLSDQLRAYYAKHLVPSDVPEPEDIDALQAIKTAQNAFDARLQVGFAAAIQELESLNYPGLTDPKLTIATRLSPTDGLSHDAAVQYQVGSDDGTGAGASLRLPEHYNGLGYQNLISMVFKLMGFRDAWMGVGKASGYTHNATRQASSPPPLHLVLVEEPEAHLHAQVQQVFVRRAYEVLRKHKDLGDQPAFQTQVVVSTHSGHIAHECLFASLRYFRRLPSPAPGDVPRSVVINLSTVFGPNDATQRFAARYLRATHCDLFFADAAVFVEGPAERILVPYFIRKHYEKLNSRYISVLEIGGSHAHRLRPLIEHLGLTTLVITDMDPAEGAGHHKVVPPKRGCGQVSRNSTLKQWHPAKEALDELLDLSEADKVKAYPIPLFSVRVAYQHPISVPAGKGVVEALASTFEDSLVFENLEFFKKASGEGMMADIKEAIEKDPAPAVLGKAMFDLLREEKRKAAFALDMLMHPEAKSLKVPGYIASGLEWLQTQLAPKTATAKASAQASTPPAA